MNGREDDDEEERRRSQKGIRIVGYLNIISPAFMLEIE